MPALTGRHGWLLGLCLLLGCQFLRPRESAVPPDGVGQAFLPAGQTADIPVCPTRDVGQAILPAGQTADRNVCPTGSESAGEPATVATISLSDAIAFALQHNPRLRAAFAEVEQAVGQEQVAFAPFLPQSDVLMRYGGTSRNLSPGAPGLTGAIIPSRDAPHSFGQVEFQLQWMICDFGRTAGRYHQAIARERIAELRLERARQTVAFDVAVAYMDGLLTAADRVIQEEAIRRAEATLKDTKSRRAAGVADRDDVLRAEVQLSESREALILAEEAELAAQARLNNAMGRNASLPLRLVDRDTQPPFSLSLTQCLDRAIAERREVGMAQEGVAATVAGRDAAAAEFKPKLYTRASLGFVGGDNILEGVQRGAAIHLDVPLYHGGSRRGGLRSAEAEVQEAIANAQVILDNVSLQVTLAYRAVLAAQKRIDLSRPAVEQAQENLRLVRNKYRNGNATPTDIVDAETALTRAQRRLSSASYDFLAALARLDYAIGRQPGAITETVKPPEELPPPRPTPKEE